jgi:hypothetical protein
MIIKGLRDLDKYVFIISIVLTTFKMKCANHGSFYLNLEEIIIKVKLNLYMRISTLSKWNKNTLSLMSENLFVKMNTN